LEQGVRGEVSVHVVGFVLFGLLIGVVTRMLVAGKTAGGWVLSMLGGIGGALFGGFLGRVLGLYGDAEPVAFVMALLGAFALVTIYHVVAARRQHARPADAAVDAAVPPT
jgi:uncharacterized membrane protein YeaQ/YmgE (transglycosylase-associated protein family)